jgi:chitin-binding protein
MAVASLPTVIMGRWSRGRRTTAIGVVVAVVVLGAFIVITAMPADAHGTMQSPASRAYHCRFGDNPTSPTLAACRDAAAIGGEQALYDWNGILLSDVAGNHRQRIPDGQLCSAGRPEYHGFDQARADWPATPVVSGTPFAFQFLGSVPHQGTIDIYITRDGFDPRRPLHWADLEDSPFLQITEVNPGGSYAATAAMPAGKTGRHIIYAIWQRSDSPEAFYSCSDVDFGGAGSTAPERQLAPPLPAAPPYQPATPMGDAIGATTGLGHDGVGVGHEHHGQGPAPSLPSAGLVQAWQPYRHYYAGAEVSYGGRTYESRLDHTSLPGWEPTNALSLWFFVPGADMAWAAQVPYSVGSVVVYSGRSYRCRQAHASLPGWDPESAPALWEPLP